jgi:anti-sigma regulatory factor (Ser/Thr protein kinase)
VTSAPGDPIRRDDSPARSTIVLGRDVKAAGDARDWLTATFGPRLSTVHLEDACLVLSELVTNALRHGLGAIVVHGAVVDDDCLRLSVTDWADEIPRLLEPDPDRIGGVGLLVVDRLSTEWNVAPFPGGKTVWASIASRQPLIGRVHDGG